MELKVQSPQFKKCSDGSDHIPLQVAKEYFFGYQAVHNFTGEGYIRSYIINRLKKPVGLHILF